MTSGVSGLEAHDDKDMGVTLRADRVLDFVSEPRPARTFTRRGFPKP